MIKTSRVCPPFLRTKARVEGAVAGKAGRRKGRKRYSLYRKLEKAGYSRDFRRLVKRKGDKETAVGAQFSVIVLMHWSSFSWDNCDRFLTLILLRNISVLFFFFFMKEEEEFIILVFHMQVFNPLNSFDHISFLFNFYSFLGIDNNKFKSYSYQWLTHWDYLFMWYIKICNSQNELQFHKSTI